MSKVFLDYLFCHLGEQMDGWIKDPTLLHSVDHILQSANYAVLKLFQALDPASIISLSLPHFLSFWILQAVTTSSPGNCNQKKSLP